MKPPVTRRELKVDLKQQVEQSLNKVRPSLQATVVSRAHRSDGRWHRRLSLRGACAGCPMSTMTLKMGIEKVLMDEIPEIRSVEAI